jgi:quinoprotein glucose dehydrogenase
VHRGVAAWRDSANGNALRIFINSRYRLFAIDADRPAGRVVRVARRDRSERRPRLGSTRRTTPTPRRRSSTRISIILGNGVGDRLVYRNDPPGDIPRVRSRGTARPETEERRDHNKRKIHDRSISGRKNKSLVS